MPPSDNDMLIGELRGKLDMIISGQATMKDELKKDINGMGTRFQKEIDDLETRVNGMETKSAQYAISIGGLSAIGFSLIKEKLGF